MITLEAIPDPRTNRDECIRFLNKQRLIIGNDECGLYAPLISSDCLSEIHYVLTWSPAVRSYGITVVATHEIPDDGIGGPGSDTEYTYVLRKSYYSYHERDGRHYMSGTTPTAGFRTDNWSKMDRRRDQMLCDARTGEQPVVQVVGERVYRLLGRNACRIGVMRVGKKIRAEQPDAVEQHEVVLLIPHTGFTTDKKHVRYLASPIDGCWSDGEDHEWNDGVIIDAEDVLLLFQD